jgi:hypothetical protein
LEIGVFVKYKSPPTCKSLGKEVILVSSKSKYPPTFKLLGKEVIGVFGLLLIISKDNWSIS